MTVHRPAAAREFSRWPSWQLATLASASLSSQTREECRAYEGTELKLKVPLYATVSDNDGRREAYKISVERYNKAMREGFYYEALLIDYALVEDRLRSWLYHIGVIANRSDRKAYRATRPHIVDMVRQRKGLSADSEVRLSLMAMNGKKEIVEATLAWHEARAEPSADNLYLTALWRLYDRALDCASARDALGRLSDWCKRRNEVVHGLLNKDLALLEPQLLPLCEEGIALFREMDGYVRQVSRGDSVRGALGLSEAK